MKNHAITIGLIVLLVFSLTSCSSEPNADEIKRRFESYTPDSSVVAVLDSSTFYFADHTLKLHDISNGESPNNGYLFVDGKLFFPPRKKTASLIFRCLYIRVICMEKISIWCLKSTDTKHAPGQQETMENCISSIILLMLLTHQLG